MKIVKSPLRYPGGKSRAIKQILRHLPARIDEYREPFVGGGSVFLAVKCLFGRRINRYVINDLVVV
ncbi:MAG: DNA adenine methylase, partial [Chloroflexi bacterium]|nr:DNA adenine methylase [Chloroflexota bacterium]